MLDEKVLNTNEVEIKKLIAESYSFREVLEKLGLPNMGSYRRRLTRFAKTINADYQHFPKTKKKTVERWSEENLNDAIVGANTYKDILEKLDVIPITSAYNRLKFYLNKYEIEFTPNKIQSARWERSNLEPIVKNSNSQRECLIKLGVRAAGGNFKQLLKYVELHGLDISHFKQEYRVPNKKIELKEVLVENSTYSRSHLKKRLYNEGLKERCCEMCGQGEEWRGQKMSLILDHINGVHNDNRIENLRIVCPNCNATLPTHAGKNKVRKKKEYTCGCGKSMTRQAKCCKECAPKASRKVDRPPYEQLVKEIEETNYCAVGRKYGVSDNAIRKWVKNYENKT